MQAIVLAVGRGTGLCAMTQEVPKCLLPINGETLLGRLVRQVTSVGIPDILVVVGYRKERVIEELPATADVKPEDRRTRK
jgi:CTP:phosphocholine cytidylyltransferase-like protein